MGTGPGRIGLGDEPMIECSAIVMLQVIEIGAGVLRCDVCEPRRRQAERELAGASLTMKLVRGKMRPVQFQMKKQNCRCVDRYVDRTEC
jgi:hypothetical protein